MLIIMMDVFKALLWRLSAVNHRTGDERPIWSGVRGRRRPRRQTAGWGVLTGEAWTMCTGRDDKLRRLVRPTAAIVDVLPVWSLQWLVTCRGSPRQMAADQRLTGHGIFSSHNMPDVAAAPIWIKKLSIATVRSTTALCAFIHSRFCISY